MKYYKTLVSNNAVNVWGILLELTEIFENYSILLDIIQGLKKNEYSIYLILPK